MVMVPRSNLVAQLRAQRFLATAGVRLIASLDLRAIVRAAAELVVPSYADWCAIHLHELDDATPAFTWTHPDGAQSPAATNPALIESVERAGRAHVLELGDDPRVIDAAFGAEHVERLRGLRTRSVACVPLAARGQVLGALAVAFAAERGRADLPPLELVENFGHLIALAVANAYAYRDALDAVRVRDDILAIVSHDLRTPLSTVLLRAERLGEYPALRKAAGCIKHAAELMSRLITDLLDASTINAGHLALDRRPHGSAAMIAEAVEMFRAEAEAREIKLREDPGPADLQVVCDRDRIIQVLANLISNALRFTPPGGRITVVARAEPGQLRIEVEDTGCGIPAEAIPRVFDRFWRAHATRHGAGLGLFIARGIVAAHGGTIGVDASVGRGSRFYFTLPAATA